MFQFTPKNPHRNQINHLKKVPKGARGKLWKSRVIQPFCLCGSERLGWRIVLSISIFPNGLDGDRNLFLSLASNLFGITILNQPKVSVERIWVNFVKCLPFRGSLLLNYILEMTSRDVKRMYHHHGAGNGALSIPPHKCLFVADPQRVLTHTSHITNIYRSTTDSAMM